MVWLQVLDLLIHMYEAEASPDFASICQCLMFLDDSRRVAHIFHTLLGGSQVLSDLPRPIRYPVVILCRWFSVGINHGL